MSDDVSGSEGLDRLGVLASGFCALHCVALALLPVVAGSLGVLAGEGAEWVFTLVAVGIAMAAFWWGWRRHRSKTVAVLFTLGAVGLLASRGVEAMVGHGHGHHAESGHEEEGGDHDHEERGPHAEAAHHGHGLGFGAITGGLAGMFLIAGHLTNIRATRRCCDAPR